MSRRPSVLIIVPRQSIRTLLEMVLSQEGLGVFAAVNLGSALLQLRVMQPDLIIIDFDGQETKECAAVARIRALSLAPLLALEDGAGPTAVQGVADILHYPLIAGQLCDKVAALLGGSSLPAHDGAGAGGFIGERD